MYQVERRNSMNSDTTPFCYQVLFFLEEVAMEGKEASSQITNHKFTSHNLQEKNIKKEGGREWKREGGRTNKLHTPCFSSFCYQSNFCDACSSCLQLPSP